MTWTELVALGLQLPEAVEDIWYRTPALKVRGKAFIRLKEDGESVVFLLDSVDEQEALTAALPDLYFITDHYRGYPAVLARLARLTEPEARLRLRRAWLLKAPKKVAAQLPSPGSSSPPSPAPGKRKAPARGQAPARPRAKAPRRARPRR